jgi:hypothetical protein
MNSASLFALTLLAAMPALALNEISWVASTGLDTNTCIRTAPCKTFQHAHDQTNPGGIVKAVDAADYGIVSINKAITIDGNGVGAEIEAMGAPGISVSAGPVTIRDLTIHATGGGDGIDASGADIHVENVTITGVPRIGVNANAIPSGAVQMTAKNLTVTGATMIGIYIGGSSASIRDSMVRGTTGPGIRVASFSGQPPAVALIERTDVSFNTTGLQSDNNTTGAGATARISDLVITNNTTGISAVNGGQIITLRTNVLAGNSTDGSTPFSISLK